MHNKTKCKILINEVNFMTELIEILENIKDLKCSLNKLINKNDDIVDEDILDASKMVYALLNEYEKQLVNQNKKSSKKA